MSRPIIGITIGDPAGIGPEVARAALASGTLDRRCEYSLIGNHSKGRPGAPGTASATAALDALEEAAARAIAGELAAVVTGPVSKARMHEIGFLFPGQTEFFAARCGVSDFAMLLTGGGLTVALVTAHIPLSAVPGALRSSEIIRVGNLLTRHLQQRNVPRPRIAVAGLNPHAGEEGALGNEESAVIRPAVERLRMEWSAQVLFDGPISPDTVFYRATRGEFDAVLCMYHDQGLIPLKLHAFEAGVNVTLGLPFPRTSPDHGTAFEIAGKGIARPGSMIAAIQLAAVLVAGAPASTRLG